MLPHKKLPYTLSRLVHKLNNIDYCKTLDAAKGKKLLATAYLQASDLVDFADYNYTAADCYGRKMIYDGGHFELMVMSWNPGAYSSIHTHGGAEWGAVQIFGKAHHIVYSAEGNLLKITRKEITDAGAILQVDAELIHQMGNPTSDRFISLHLYCSTAVTNNVTAYAKNFDIEFNRVAFTTGGAFFNLPQSNIHKIEKGIRTTPEVFIHYAFLLLNYYSRQNSTPKLLQLKESLLKQIKKRVVCMDKTVFMDKTELFTTKLAETVTA